MNNQPSAYLGKIDDNILKLNLGCFNYHSVILGQSGSGKTGLGIVMLESFIMNGIPVIAIDPKGDLGNLLYTPYDWSVGEMLAFQGEERRGNPEVLAGAHYQIKGLQESWETNLLPPNLGREFLIRSDIPIFTPGGSHGMPISLLGSLKSPALADDQEREAMSLAQAILKLVGCSYGSTDWETVLVSLVIRARWDRNQDTTLIDIANGLLRAGAIIDRVGAMSLEDYAPEEKRLALARKVNSLVASSDFQKWTKGPSLSIDQLFRTPRHPRCSILNVAHLNDNEKAFYLTIFLEKVITWMKTQGGTSELRAVLYIDEVQGLIPSVANPRTKQQLMTLLKQARAFGLGIILATQNPGDIDYKGLSNIGNWFVGRLQTDRDRSKVCEIIGKEHKQTISELEKREFLLYESFGEGNHSIKFKSRQTVSYLRGPLDQEEITRLVLWRKELVTKARLVPNYDKISDMDMFRAIYQQYHFCPYDDDMIQQKMANNLAWQSTMEHKK